jgi:cytidylate kinase
MSPSPRGLVVALDGPASSGKSSVGAAAALRLGYRFCDTGLLYRALTWLALRRGVALDDAAGLVALAPEVHLAPDEHGRHDRVVVDGTDVTADARSPEVDVAVSEVARQADVRAAMLPVQRALAADGGIVMAGRDIGTVVLPDADLKLYLDASAEERARRRAEERGLDPASPEAQAILAALRERDAVDGGREVAPLRIAPDAVVLKTDGAAFGQTVERVVDAIQAAAAQPADPPVDPPIDPPIDPSSATARPSTPARTGMSSLSDEFSPLLRATGLAARIGMSCFTRVSIGGAVDRIPREGPLIVATNHLSNADGVAIEGWLQPLLGRRVHWLAKKEMVEWPVLGGVVRRLSVHPVDRSRADVEAFRVAERILEAGHVLVVFPEGTRSRDGALAEAKDGLALLAMRTDATILPIGIDGTDRVWPRSTFPRPGGRVTVRVGEPFRVVDVVPAGVDRRTAKRLATEAIMGRIAALLPPRRRGPYASAATAASSPNGPSGDPVR